MRQDDYLSDGDAQFTGVNELLPPGVLAPGEMASCKNGRCRYGKDEPRAGFFKVPWSTLVTSGASSVPVPYGTIYGRGYFQDEDSVLWCIIAADGKVYKFRDGNGSSEVPLPSGVTITSAVEFTQTYNGLLMFRGLGKDTLLMSNLGAGFASATPQANTVTDALSENPAAGAESVPQADRGEWIDARLYVPTETATEKDLVNISDFLNATRFASVRAQARINQGSNDRLIRVLKFGKEHAAVCFKTASVYALYGTTGSLSEMQQDEITRQFGLLSPRGCINVGKDEADAPDEVWFMSTSGSIHRITPDGGTGLLGVSSVPVSEEMVRTIARINLEVAARTVTFELFQDRLYVAVPLDDATQPGPEILRSQSYGAGTLSWPVVPGKTYFWTKGANDTAINNGSEQLTSSGQFTAASGVITLSGSGSVTASLKRLFTGVNNAVLVFDFLKGKWCGYDEATGMMVQHFIKLPIGGEEKLMFSGADGFINYAEALFDDEVAYESYGANLLSGGDETTALFTVTTVPGRTYIYATDIDSSGTGTITNGTEIIALPGAGSFVAQATSVAVAKVSGLWTQRFMYLLAHTLEYVGVDHDRTTRAYRAGSLARKRFPWLAINVRTFNPSLSVTALFDGVNEEFPVVTADTRDNTRYLKPAGKPRWVTTNQNDDHDTAYRQDYHVELSDAVSNGSDIVAGQLYYVDSTDAFTAASVTYNSVVYDRGDTFLGVAGQTSWSTTSGSPVVYPPGSYTLPGANGVVLDLHQDTREEFRVGRRGREVQFRLRNTQGRCEVTSLQIEAFPVDRARQHSKG